MITRDQAIAEYIDALGGNTGQQAAALLKLCDTMEHIGWMAGFKACSEQNSKVFDVLFGKVLPMPTLQDGHGDWK